jgi:hypothetical protein
MAQSLDLECGLASPSGRSGRDLPGTGPADRVTRNASDACQSNVRHSNAVHCESNGCCKSGHSIGNAPPHAVRHSSSVPLAGNTRPDSQMAACHNIPAFPPLRAHGRPEEAAGTTAAARRKRLQRPEALSGNDSRMVFSCPLIRLPRKSGLMIQGKRRVVFPLPNERRETPAWGVGMRCGGNWERRLGSRRVRREELCRHFRIRGSSGGALRSATWKSPLPGYTAGSLCTLKRGTASG